MVEATTPTIKLRLPSTIDLSSATKIFVSFRQQNLKLTKTLDDGVAVVEHNRIAVTLTQEETLMFVPKFMVDVQVNWFVGAARFATKQKKINVIENLIPEVIT